MNVDANLVSAVLVAVVGGGGLWAYLGGQNKNKVDLVTIAQDAAGAVIKGLHDELDRMRSRITELEAQDERCRKALDELRARIG